MQEVMENNIEIEEDQHDMGSYFRGMIQMKIGYAILSKYQHQLMPISELSLDILGKEYKPDVSIYPYKPINMILDDDLTKVKEMPLCAIEILSPTQFLPELKQKIKFYLNQGILSCWLIIPDIKTIQIYTLEQQLTFNTKDILKDDILNIEFPVSELF